MDGNRITTGLSASMTNSWPGRELPDRWIDALFGKFSVIWMRTWADLVSKVDIDILRREWAEGLAGLSGEQVKLGIEICRAQSVWPPTIAEFRDAAQGGRNAEQRAFDARAKHDALALSSRTWAETKEAGAVKAQVAKAAAKKQRPQRTIINIANGTWTRELEDAVRKDMGMLGMKYEEPEWPAKEGSHA